MSDYFLGEIRMFGGNYAPEDFALCNGQLLPIAQYQALYSLWGTTYGGDGVTTFGVPNLCGRAVVGRGQGAGLSSYTVGQKIGVNQVTLSTAQIPPHTHAMTARTDQATATAPANMVFAAPASGVVEYIDPTTDSTAVPRILANDVTTYPTQPTLAHQNVMPSMGITFICATVGLYPSFS